MLHATSLHFSSYSYTFSSFGTRLESPLIQGLPFWGSPRLPWAWLSVSLVAVQGLPQLPEGVLHGLYAQFESAERHPSPALLLTKHRPLEEDERPYDFNRSP
jgi:hypothetical protein